MALKFCANLNFLFSENNSPYLQRFYMAKKAGFKGVEIAYPDKVSPRELELVKAETDLELVLMNIKLGNDVETQFGSTSLPGYQKIFEEHFLDTLSLAKKLNCQKIHLMAGLVANEPLEKHYETYVKNLMFAAPYLEREQILGLIEPINNYTLPNYYLNSFSTAEKILKDINSPNLKLMVDLFHLQHITGNITIKLKELMPFIGHFQIAQVPHRHEPNSPGELNYEYVFDVIKETGYNGWIGCEYKPKNGTKNGLDWINQFGFEL